MKIVRLESSIVAEILPKETYALGIAHWYGADFATQCVEAPDEVRQGWVHSNGAFSAPAPAPVPTPEQIREGEYENLKVIVWKGDLITVNDAAQLVMYYLAEGDTETVTTLQSLIAPAKEAIRAEHPDVV